MNSKTQILEVLNNHGYTELAVMVKENKFDAQEAKEIALSHLEASSNSDSFKSYYRIFIKFYANS